MSSTEDIIAALFIILYCSKVTLASAAQCKDSTSSIPNRVLTAHVFLTKSSPGIDDCLMLCIEHDPSCESINYYRKTNVCELNNKTIGTNPDIDDMADYEWAIYMTNSVRLLPCNEIDLECGRQGDICQRRKGDNKCKDCSGALGLENGKIPDSALTASSFYRDGLGARFVRLNSPTSWTAAISNLAQWLQIDLGQNMAVKKIGTQSRHNQRQWVRSYTVTSRVDGGDWVPYQEENAVKVFQGNTEMHTVVSHVFSQHIKARYVRILPQAWFNHISIRAELYGCALD